ncbi:MAG: hypothetical protein IKS71_07545 [Bacteroidales bacterium]|nr:hypothetical protein [Bacteroidales bacterium]
MKKFFAILSIAALVFAACEPNNNTDEPQLPSAAGLTPVVTVDGNLATFSLPEGATGLIPIWYTNESGDFVFAGNGNNFQKTFFEGGTFKVRMYVSNSNGQSKDYAEAEFTVEGQEGWNGYNYNSQYNIWKVGEDAGMEGSYTWCSPGWAGEVSVPFTTNPYTLTVPGACSDRWQCQFHLVPGANVALSADKHYDFSCIIELTKSAGVTVKITDVASDDNFLFVTLDDMPAGENVYWMKDVAGIDASAVKVVFDFGYSEAGNDVKITRITLKDHANDDGTNAPDKDTPEPEPQPEVTQLPEGYVFNTNTSANLWKAVADANGEKYFYYFCNGGDWNGTETETTDVPFLVKNANSYQITIENATASQWQNQFFIWPNEGSFIALSDAKKYALQVKLSASVNTPGFFKIEQYAAGGPKHEGATIWEYGAYTITAGEDLVLTSPVISGVACDNVNLIFDFGGNAAGAVVTIKDICLQEFTE